MAVYTVKLEVDFYLQLYLQECIRSEKTLDMFYNLQDSSLSLQLRFESNAAFTFCKTIFFLCIYPVHVADVIYFQLTMSMANNVLWMCCSFDIISLGSLYERFLLIIFSLLKEKCKERIQLPTS